MAARQSPPRSIRLLYRPELGEADSAAPRYTPTARATVLPTVVGIYSAVAYGHRHDTSPSSGEARFSHVTHSPTSGYHRHPHHILHTYYCHKNNSTYNAIRHVVVVAPGTRL